MSQPPLPDAEPPTQPQPTAVRPAVDHPGPAAAGSHPPIGPAGPAAGSPSGLPPAWARGRLHLADTTVEKIAGFAAAEVDGVIEQSGRGLGRSRGVKADASILGTSAKVRLSVGLAYPIVVPACVDAIRDRVIGRVRELADVEVAELDIHVDVLEPPHESRRRVE